MEGEHHEGASIPFSQLPLYQEYIAEQRTPQITVTHRTFEFCSPISSSEKPTGVESCVMGSVGASFFSRTLSSTLAKLRFIDRAQPRDPARYLR